MAKSKDAPICSKCGGTGAGVLFSIFSKFGFGTFCVPCEKLIEAASGSSHD